MRQLLFLLWVLSGSMASFAQRKVSELILTYDLSISRNEAQGGAAGAQPTAAIMTIYIKGPMSRTDLNYPSFSTSTILNARAGNAVILQEVSGQKLIRKLTAENWLAKNKRYQGISFVPDTVTRTIAGYLCNKAEARLADGTTFSVYYTTDMSPENKDYDFMFRELNGLPLEWAVVQGKNKVQFTLNKIALNPVPASRFDIPSTGYRELPYEE
jgi:hypothetical protein